MSPILLALVPTLAAGALGLACSDTTGLDPATLTFTNVSAGGGYTCAVTPEGRPFCWGFNNHGQLGDRSMIDRLSPTPVQSTIRLSSVAVHGDHSCGVAADGRAYCWGYNLWGELGNGEPPTQEDSVAVVPTAVVGGATFRFVTLGSSHTCGVTVAGMSLCWGYGGLGQLGAGNGPWYNSAPVAVAVADGQAFDSLSAGAEHTCGLTAGGEAFCWGANHRGQLGDGTVEHRSVPTAVQGGLTFRSVRATGTTTCGIVITGAAYCWGLGEFGQLGAGDLESSYTPTLVHGELVFTSLSAHGAHACSLTPAGDAYCWGSNLEGQLGDGTTTDRRVPTLVTGDLTFVSLSAGAGHTCGLVSDGALFCWGANHAGQLGDGTRESTAQPRRIAGPSPSVTADGIQHLQRP